MIKMLEQAIEKIRNLPEDRQADAAEILEQMAADDGSVFKVPKDDRAAIAEGLEQLKRGEFASDDDMSALWKKCGL
jgi:predicted transcriptional regulator